MASTKGKAAAGGNAKGGGAKGGNAPGNKNAPKGGGQKGGKKGGEGGKGAAPKMVAPKGSHAGLELPVPAPRLKDYYNSTVRARLAEQFSLGNPHQVPTVEKVVVNVGVGEAVKQPRMLDAVVEELTIITGQRPVRRKAKKSIANFGLREGQEIGAAVTLRGARMWEFLDRFITMAIPRIRDFRGLNTRSFDGRGNYSVGIKEQMIFPEINYDMIESIHGMDVTIVTTAGRDDLALALLKELGMPFRGEERAAGKGNASAATAGAA